MGGEIYFSQKIVRKFLRRLKLNIKIRSINRFKLKDKLVVIIIE